MATRKKTETFKKVLTIAFLCLLGASSIVFSTLYVDSCGIEFIRRNSKIITPIVVALASVFSVLSIVFYADKKDFLYKIFALSIACYVLIILCLYVFRVSGLNDKINSVESFRDYIRSFGAYAVILFIAVQFLQVAVLPIPAFITVGAGVLLFGPLKSAVYSLIGIFLGSMTAFIIGRIFGFKVAKWLVGEQDLKKWLTRIKGKDKVVLTFMFLFPFFPDDILCFVAGITTMSPLYFTVMIIVTRTISVFSSCYSLNNDIIPYTTWWGILIWIVLIALCIVLCVIVYRYGDKIERLFKKHKGKTSKVK
ncbi:MAG: TVP38/TMEM64 family protein [Clostridia bacterium]|nr:TVP38/TMEM64 family protein [Clostridia bacterium]